MGSLRKQVAEVLYSRSGGVAWSILPDDMRAHWLEHADAVLAVPALNELVKRSAALTRSKQQ